VTSGEGGAIIVNDPDLEPTIRLLRGQGMDPARRYFFPVIGYNYRLTNVACAILCAQLERFPALAARRAELFAEYERRLEAIPGIGLQPTASWAEPARWLVSVTVDADEFGITRDELASRLERAEIETRPFFLPIHRLPPYAGRPGAQRPLPVTDALAATGINLPTSTLMSDEDVGRVADAIAEARSRRPAT
jgi:perosamine synthetase